MQPLAENFQYLGIDITKLKGQSVVAKDMILGQTGLHNAEDVLQFLMTMPCAFPDLVTFTRLTLTIPVSSANSERSFSTLKRVKTYLRSNMSEQRLNGLCMLSIEKELSLSLLQDTSEVVDKFASMKNRRLNLLLST